MRSGLTHRGASRDDAEMACLTLGLARHMDTAPALHRGKDGTASALHARVDGISRERKVADADTETAPALRGDAGPAATADDAASAAALPEASVTVMADIDAELATGLKTNERTNIEFRDRVGKRVTAPGPVQDDCRVREGIGKRLTEAWPSADTANAGNLQLDLLDDPKAFAVLAAAGCYPARVKGRAEEQSCLALVSHERRGVRRWAACGEAFRGLGR